MKKPRLSKETALYISIAERPSNTGTAVFNAAFESLGIDAIYKACQVNEGALADAIAGIRALGIRGCGVSMPFKKDILPYLDALDPLAKEIGAVNTVVNKKGVLCGYNTDTTAARNLLQEIRDIKNKRVVLLGSGGVAQAISCALVHLKVRNVTVISRSQLEGEALVKKWRFHKSERWSQRNRVVAEIFINATPVGMAPRVSEMPISEAAISHFDTVVDVVATPPETRLITKSVKSGKRVLRGADMAVIQALQQFKLYTGKMAPEAVMRASLVELGRN